MSCCRHTFNERLRKRVGDRLAKIDRRLGYLVARVYWRQPGTDFERGEKNYPWYEVPVWEFIDTGLINTGANGQEFIPEMKERTLDMRVNKSWAVQCREAVQRLEYSVVYERESEQRPLSFVGFEAKDNEIFARLQLREINIYKYHD